MATNSVVGDSKESRSCTYYRLKPVVVTKLTNPSAGKMTVYYEKSSGGTGYVVRYSTNSDMSDATVRTIQGVNTTSMTFPVKKGKTYYVQVRAVRTEGTGSNVVRYYSGFCTSRKIKIEK